MRTGARVRRIMRPIVGFAIAPALVASHWTGVEWRDQHDNYPPHPSGYVQVVNTFGQPCNEAANWNSARWRAGDNGRVYEFRFHRKLGGRRTTIVRDQSGRSTNLDNDVWGHLNARHLTGDVRSGIWGYACRYIAGTTKWSTHAWGIAVDVSASYEHVGHHHSHVNGAHADIWERHKWYWGKAFGDAMHFQYADRY